MGGAAAVHFAAPSSVNLVVFSLVGFEPHSGASTIDVVCRFAIKKTCVYVFVHNSIGRAFLRFDEM